VSLTSNVLPKNCTVWRFRDRLKPDFLRPGKPADNAFIESSQGSFQDECLNLHLLLSLQDAKEKIEPWREEYNTLRPHSSLDDLTPKEFAEQHANSHGNHSRLFLSATGTEKG